MTTTLQADGLTKIYQIGETTIRAVDEVSLEVTGGEFVALVGPSGSGKTTLMAMLAGLLSPTEGEVRINDQNMAALDEAARTRFRREHIGFTFQDNNLVSYLTAQENVELMLRLNRQYHNGGAEKAASLLDELGLDDYRQNLPGQLSGGQQQRVAIARALVHDPQVVLADEPTASLDTKRAYQVVNTFAELVRSQERVGLMVTHDLRMCAYVDRIFELVDGAVARIITDEDDIAAYASTNSTDEQG